MSKGSINARRQNSLMIRTTTILTFLLAPLAALTAESVNQTAQILVP